MPSAGRNDLVLEVRACGVCRTDLQLSEGDLPARRTPIVPGHQVVGRVIEVGADAGRWKVGDRAGIGWLAETCGVCSFCVAGRENLCPRARFTGWDRDGGYASRIVVRADFAFEIPDNFSDLEAAPLLCGGVIGYRALKLSRIKRGGRLGLYGFGASALLTLQVARHWGCRVFVCTRSASEQERARAMGAEWAGHYDETPPEALDAAVTFAPAGDVVVAALKAVDRGGTVAVNAIHLDGIPAFDYEYLWQERAICSIANYTRNDAREFLRLAQQIPIHPTYEAFRLEEANVALERIKLGRISGAAVLQLTP